MRSSGDKGNKSIIIAAILTGASFAGYNIGSGFATGVEAMQFFASWGAARGYMGLIVAAALGVIILSIVYVVGYEQHFRESSQVYDYFLGKRIGRLFDVYIYVSMVIVTLALISGAGATINQYLGVKEWIGASVLGVVCIVTSMFGLERLKRILGYLTILIIVFVVGLAVYVLMVSDVGPVEGSARVEEYTAQGYFLHASVFGFDHWISGGLASLGMLITSGFAWASLTGTLCKSRGEAILSGVFSSVCFYATTAVVIYLLLVSMDCVVGHEVPLLAIVQRFTPSLSIVYSAIIIVAIFSTVSGRLFTLAERYGKRSRMRELVIVTVITVIAVLGTTVISFNLLINLMFIVCGGVGLIMGILIIIGYAKRRV